MAKLKRRRPLTREEWRELAEKLQRMTVLMTECDKLLWETLTVKGMEPYRKAFGRVQSARMLLEKLAFSQGQHGMALFHGPAWTYHAEWR